LTTDLENSHRYTRNYKLKIKALYLISQKKLCVTLVT